MTKKRDLVVLFYAVRGYHNRGKNTCPEWYTPVWRMTTLHVIFSLHKFIPKSRDVCYANCWAI